MRLLREIGECWRGVAALRAAERGTREAARARGAPPRNHRKHWQVAGCFSVLVMMVLGLGLLLRRRGGAATAETMADTVALLAMGNLLTAAGGALWSRAPLLPRGGFALTACAPLPLSSVLIWSARTGLLIGAILMAMECVFVVTAGAGVRALLPYAPRILAVSTSLAAYMVAIPILIGAMRPARWTRWADTLGFACFAGGMATSYAGLMSTMGAKLLGSALGGLATPACVCCPPVAGIRSLSLPTPSGIAMALTLAGIAATWLVASGVAWRILPEDLLAAAERVARARTRRQSVFAAAPRRVRWPAPFGTGGTALWWQSLVEFRSVGSRIVRVLLAGTAVMLAVMLAVLAVYMPGTSPAEPRALACLAAMAVLVSGWFASFPNMAGLGRAVTCPTRLLRLPLPPTQALAHLCGIPLAASLAAGLAMLLPLTVVGGLAVQGVPQGVLAAMATVVGLHVARTACWLAWPPWRSLVTPGLLAGVAASCLVPVFAIGVAVAAHELGGLPPDAAIAAGALPGLIAAGVGWPIAVRLFRRLEIA